ncbi:hypothetical protein CH063_08978, partial [Colletotrichum higginsianum]
AEKLVLNVLDTGQRMLREEDPNTLAGIHNSASAYITQGLWTYSEELRMHIVNIQWKVLGVEHPNTLISMINLAYAYLGEVRWEEAEMLLEQALDKSK